jgi:sugar phosphate isomerase/epimerase
MDSSITTDFLSDCGSPELSLRLIAEAGFRCVHWCHQWNTDFLYEEPEIEQIGRWLDELGLRVPDLHASDGKEKRWISMRPYERTTGVGLVKNRIDMARRLGAEVIVMHAPNEPERAADPAIGDRLRRSLDELAPYAKQRGVRIAVENAPKNSRGIRELFGSYGADFLGLCYDCGHGNIDSPAADGGGGLDALDEMKDRLIALHLHDNDGSQDQHRLPFTGTVDWPRLARIIAASGYGGCVTMESNVHAEVTREPREFLARARAAGSRIGEMIAAARALSADVNGPRERR